MPPRLCFAGPMLGRNKGWVTTQGEVVADLFSAAGYPVRITSTIPSRIPRMLDILRSLWMWRSEYDVVILSVFSGPGFVAADIASRMVKLIRKPLISVLHGGNLPPYANQHSAAVRGLLDRSSLVVSPSNYLASFFQEWGCPVEVIPNVLAMEEYPYRCREQVRPNLLWMRTFHKTYHPEMAVEALEHLLKRYPEARLTMAGQEKGLLGEVKARVEQKGLSDCVRFPGFLSTEDKRREFDRHDIYLHTNRIDNMPVSVVEAGAFGLPVVATRVGGIPFLLEHEQNALLVESEDALGMAEAIARLVESPELAHQLSIRGRMLAENCAWENVRKQWDRAFEKVMQHV